MKLKDRDKYFIVILLVVVLIFVAYYFGFRNINTKREEVDVEVEQLSKEYDSLKLMEKNKDKYIKDTKTYNTNTDALFEKFNTGYSQVYTLKFLEELQDLNNVWIKSASLAETQPIYYFGQVTSTNPDRAYEQVYTSDRVGYSTTISLSFQGEYEATKKLINYINDYMYKCRIDAFSTSYNAESDVVSGNLTITIYAITGSDRVYEEPYISNHIFSTPNIFKSSIFEAGDSTENNGNDIISDYDIYLTLQSSEADINALEMGLKTDTAKNSSISDNDNKVKDVEIHVTGSDNEYKISYKVGNVTYPVANYAEGADVILGNKLSMLVISSERDSIKDNSGANVKIINETDKVFYIKVINEDLANPRFVIKSTTGDVVIYED